MSRAGTRHVVEEEDTHVEDADMDDPQSEQEEEVGEDLGEATKENNPKGSQKGVGSGRDLIRNVRRGRGKVSGEGGAKKKSSSSRTEIPDEELETTEVSKKRKKPSYVKMDRYLFRIMKTVDPDYRISKKGMDVVNAFMIDILERMATEGGALVKKTGKSTLKMRDSRSAAMLVLPGELARMGIAEGQRAVQQYSNSVGVTYSSGA